MKTLGLKKTLFITVLSALIITLSIVTFSSYMLFKDKATNDLIHSIQNTMDYEGNILERNIEENINTVTQLAAFLNNADYQQNYERQLAISARTAGVSKITLGFDDGRSFTSNPSDSFPNGIGSLDNYDPRTRPWYKLGESVTEATLSDVFFTREGVPLSGVVAPIQGGVVLSDIRLNQLQTAIENMRVVDGSVGIITDEKGMVLASNTEFAQVRDNINQIAFLRTALNQPAGHEIKISGQQWLTFSGPLDVAPNKQWRLMIFADPTIVYAPVYSLVWNLILVSLFITFVSALCLGFMLKQIYRPILSLKAIVQDLSQGEGDLTRRLKVESRDDLGQIATGINQFISKLQSQMLEVNDVSKNLSSRVESLHKHSQISQAALSEHISQTTLIVAAVEELANTAGLVANNAKSSADLTSNANTLGNQSQVALEQAQSTIHTLVNEIDVASTNVKMMENETQSIQSIVDVIGGIAEQTNLLALNASIEAARAGEQGRGFAVVADEVRALAARTQTSTSEIESTLKELNNVSNNVVKAISSTKETCSNMVSETQNVSDRLVDLGASVDQTHEISSNISCSANEQNQVITSINQNIHHIHSMVDKIQQELDAQHSDSEQISVIHNQLEGTLSHFKI